MSSLSGGDVKCYYVAKFAILVLSWMFVIGVAGCVILVIPIAAYQPFSVLFQKDHPHELDPSATLTC
jgi:hypothetical protein